jgi:hypothetical protein
MRRLRPVALLFLLAACGGSGSSSESSSPPQETEAFEVGNIAEAPADPAAPRVDVALPRLAYSYTLGYSLAAADLPATMTAHVERCAAMGPARCRLIAEERATGDGDYLSGRLQFDVAAGEARAFADALDRSVADAGGSPRERKVEAEDLSRLMIDTQARIAAKQALAERLTELIRRRDGTVGELVEAERAFAEAQGELESARALMAEMERRVAMSRVSANYRSTAPVGAAAGRPIAEALASAGQTLGSSLATAIMVLIAALPWVAIGLAAVWLVRRWRRGRPPQG